MVCKIEGMSSLVPSLSALDFTLLVVHSGLYCVLLYCKRRKNWSGEAGNEATPILHSTFLHCGIKANWQRKYTCNIPDIEATAQYLNFC